VSDLLGGVDESDSFADGIRVLLPVYFSLGAGRAGGSSEGVLPNYGGQVAGWDGGAEADNGVELKADVMGLHLSTAYGVEMGRFSSVTWL